MKVRTNKEDEIYYHQGERINGKERATRLISRMGQFAESLARCSNVGYAVVSRRKGREKQGWNKRELGIACVEKSRAMYRF
jgi:hypothetical protein